MKLDPYSWTAGAVGTASAGPDLSTFTPGGQDQIRFDLPAAAAISFIRHPRVLPALRLFNLRLMRKGICVYGRNHCFALADQLVAGGLPIERNSPG